MLRCAVYPLERRNVPVFSFKMCKVVKQHPLMLRLCVVVRARDEGDPRGRPKNIDVALSENLVGSQT